MPPITTVANGRCTSAPVPVAIALVIGGVLISLVCGVIGLIKAKDYQSGRGMAIAGIVLSALWMVGVLIFAAGVPGLFNGDFRAGVLGYAVMRLALVVQWLLAARGDMAIVLCEQYYDFAEELADQYLVMERGEIIARGPGSEMAARGILRLVAI